MTSSFLSSRGRKIIEWAIFPVFFIIALSFAYNHHHDSKAGRIINADQEGYYQYLPAVFIYDGFAGFQLKNCCRKNEETQEWISKYTYGCAILQTPFFLTAHALADENPLQKVQKVHRNEQDGFTMHYAWSVLVAGCFYTCMGLLLLYFVIKRLTSVLVALVTICTVFFATNLFHYTIDEAGMSHAYSFFLFALALFLLPKFLAKPSWKMGLLLGVPLGLIILIRPTNIVFVLVVFLWEVYNFQDLKARIILLFKNLVPVFCLAIPFIIVLIPQLMYWHHMSGDYIYYSYRDQGFDNWNSPYIFSVLFSHQNGLFAYTPIMLLIFPGLYFSFKKKAHSPFLFLALFLIPLYIFASWWAWWFGAAFGQRSFVEYYAIFALPLSLFLYQMSKKSIIVQSLFLILIIWASIGNVKMTMKYASPWEGEKWTTERYWEQVDHAFLF